MWQNFSAGVDAGLSGGSSVSRPWSEDPHQHYITRTPINNQVSSLLKNLEKEHYGNKFNDENSTTQNVWKTAYEVLGKFINSFPSQILHGGRLLSNPAEIATEVNKFFIDKIKKLKEEFKASKDEDPVSELKKYLSKKNIPREGFSLKELNDEDVKKL